MKYLKRFNESRFQEFRELISNIKDLSLEFEDNDCQCKIFPDDEIKLNILSLKSRGHLGSITQPFYLEIDIDRRIILEDTIITEWGNKKFVSRFPDWFIENCKEIESYMISEGFKTLPSIKYTSGWKELDSIDELSEFTGDGFPVIYKVRLEFLPL